MDARDEDRAEGVRTYAGGCHCGAVRFEVKADLSRGGTRCNCSVCTKIAATAHVVKPAAFALRAGEDSLTSYEWGAKISKRYFCEHCGVHCFGRGFLEELTAEHAVLLLCHPIEPGTSLFLEMRSLDRRLTRMPLATVDIDITFGSVRGLWVSVRPKSGAC